MTTIRDPLLPNACPRATAPLHNVLLVITLPKTEQGIALPVSVDLCGVQAQDLLDGTDDSAESLVDFEKGDVFNLKAGLLDGGRQRDTRGQREVDRWECGISESCK